MNRITFDFEGRWDPWTSNRMVPVSETIIIDKFVISIIDVFYIYVSMKWQKRDKWKLTAIEFMIAFPNSIPAYWAKARYDPSKLFSWM